MNTSEIVFKCAKVMKERFDSVNIGGTIFYVFASKIKVGDSNELVRCEIEIILGSSITVPFMSFVYEKILPNLSRPVISQHHGSVIIGFDYE